jgi:hypothetical protein
MTGIPEKVLLKLLSGLLREFFFKVCHRPVTALKHQPLVIIDDPFNHFALLEFDGLGYGSGKIDIPLLTFCPFDELDFSWITHI